MAFAGMASGAFAAAADAGEAGRAENMAARFVLVVPDGTIAGYYTLSAMSVHLAELPAQTVRKLPRYPLVPAAKPRIRGLLRPPDPVCTGHALHLR